MKSLIIITFIWACFCTLLSAQTVKHDTGLIQKIDTMFKYDQFWRKEYIKVLKKEKSMYDKETIERRWAIAGSINELKAKAIINQYGYPGYNLIGEISNDFWAIIQHCDNDIKFQERVLVLMKKEADKNNASKANYAYLVDRILTNKHQKQIYGTQLTRNTKTGKFSPFPLKYPKSVNKLRKQVGLEPLKEYVKSFEL